MTVDWFRVLADLQRCGMSLRAVSRRAGVAYKRLYGVWRGETQDLRHADGESVLRIWAKTVQRDMVDAPKFR